MSSGKGLVGIKTLANRAVHIKLSSATRSIQDSRDVLHFLKSYGEVVSFRNLKYDSEVVAPHTIVAIFQQAESAEKLMADSPLHITVGQDSRDAKKKQGLATSLSELYRASLEQLESQPSHEQPSRPEPLSMTLHVDESRDAHYGRIRRQEFYWGNNEPARTRAQDDLANQVPVEGLATIKAVPNTLWARIVRSKQAAVDQRKSLRQLYDEGLDAPSKSSESSSF